MAAPGILAHPSFRGLVLRLAAYPGHALSPKKNALTNELLCDSPLCHYSNYYGCVAGGRRDLTVTPPRLQSSVCSV